MWIVFNGRFTIEILIFGIVLSAALYLFVWKSPPLTRGAVSEADWGRDHQLAMYSSHTARR